MEYYLAVKKNELGYIQQHREISEAFCQVKEGRHKNFYLYDSKSLETEIRLMIARGYG